MNPEMDVGTNKKALQINIDAKKYGTFAEIGAGQEVAVGEIASVFGDDWRDSQRLLQLVLEHPRVDGE